MGHYKAEQRVTFLAIFTFEKLIWAIKSPKTGKYILVASEEIQRHYDSNNIKWTSKDNNWSANGYEYSDFTGMTENIYHDVDWNVLFRKALDGKTFKRKWDVFKYLEGRYGKIKN